MQHQPTHHERGAQAAASRVHRLASLAVLVTLLSLLLALCRRRSRRCSSCCPLAARPLAILLAASRLCWRLGCRRLGRCRLATLGGSRHLLPAALLRPPLSFVLLATCLAGGCGLVGLRDGRCLALWRVHRGLVRPLEALLWMMKRPVAGQVAGSMRCRLPAGKSRRQAA